MQNSLSRLFKCCLSVFTDFRLNTRMKHKWSERKIILNYWIIWINEVPLHQLWNGTCIKSTWKRMMCSICGRGCSSRMYRRAALLGLCWDSGQTSVQPEVTLRSSILMFISQILNDNMIECVFILISSLFRLRCRKQVSHLWCMSTHSSFSLSLVDSLAGECGAYMSQMELRQTGFDVSDLCISHLCRLMQNLGYWSQQGNPGLTGVWASVCGIFVLHNSQDIFSR